MCPAVLHCSEEEPRSSAVHSIVAMDVAKSASQQIVLFPRGEHWLSMLIPLWKRCTAGNAPVVAVLVLVVVVISFGLGLGLSARYMHRVDVDCRVGGASSRRLPFTNNNFSNTQIIVTTQWSLCFWCRVGWKVYFLRLLWTLLRIILNILLIVKKDV